MSASVTIKSYDTGIQFTDALKLAGAAYNLTGCSLKFIIRLKGVTAADAFADAATIVSAVAGTVSYLPGAGFPTDVGKYQQEWEVTTPLNRVITFPGGEYNEVKIITDLNEA
jgi:hypothetical protein